MSAFTPLLRQALQENAMAINKQAEEKLVRYLELLQTWNHVFNLTAITNPHEMVYLHIIDSLAAAPYLHGNRLLDVGSGAGLPGIPLAIAHPKSHWVLLDKNGKKTRFLTQAIAELELPNAEAAYARCEEFHPSEGFDSILSRAYGTINTFVETTKHLLKPTGIFIAMKGKYPQEELETLSSRFIPQSVARLDLKGIAVERHIVALRVKK